MKTNSTFKYGFVLLLLSPILGLISGLKARGIKSQKWLLICFVTIYGSIIHLNPNTDGVFHLTNLYEHYLDLSFSEFTEELWDIVTLKPQSDTNDDLYIHVLSFVLGSVLGVPGLFFVIVSFVYGYFYITGVFKVITRLRLDRTSFFLASFLLLFILYRGVDSMNSVRMWTGLWILFNGVFGYFFTKGKSYLFLIAAAPLVHIAYLVVVLPVVAVVLLGARPWLYTLIFAGSLLIQGSGAGIAGILSSSQVGEAKVRSYYQGDDEEAAAGQEHSSDDLALYARYGKGNAIRWGSLLLAGTLLLGGAYHRRMTLREQLLFSAGLCTLSLANFAGFIPELQGRSYIVGGLFLLPVLLFLLVKQTLYGRSLANRFFMKSGLYAALGIFSLYILYTIANLLHFTSIYMISVPMIPWIWEELNYSIREVIGWFL